MGVLETDNFAQKDSKQTVLFNFNFYFYHRKSSFQVQVTTKRSHCKDYREAINVYAKDGGPEAV